MLSSGHIGSGKRKWSVATAAANTAPIFNFSIHTYIYCVTKRYNMYHILQPCIACTFLQANLVPANGNGQSQPQQRTPPLS